MAEMMDWTRYWAEKSVVPEGSMNKCELFNIGGAVYGEYKHTEVSYSRSQCWLKLYNGRHRVRFDVLCDLMHTLNVAIYSLSDIMLDIMTAQRLA